MNSPKVGLNQSEPGHVALFLMSRTMSCSGRSLTGWNEWIAGRWGEPTGPLVFVDQLDQEFSRDIEPMKGGHGDNYYWQLVANVRRYKGAPASPKRSPPKTIRIKDSFDQWRDVAPEFVDHVGETLPQDFDGIAGQYYANNSGRNDLVASQVARDARNLHFHVRTREAITPRSGTNWMWLLIDADQNSSTGWEGYDFIVHRSAGPKSEAWLEKNAGGWNWQKISPVSVRVEGNELQLAIRRAALNLSKGGTQVAIDFQWADNLQRPGEIMDFYVSGDVAPEGRFNYRYSRE